MNKISDITRQDILDVIRHGFVIEYEEPIQDWETGEYITEAKVFMPFFGRLDYIKFLNRVYNLASLPSYDSRYSDALGDITCHYHFGDYDDDFWFFDDERFLLRDGDGDESILKFICEMLHPAVRNEKSQWKQYLEKFNELLEPDGYELYPAQHISGRDVFAARENTHSDKMILPEGLFTERYKDLISIGNGGNVDKISFSVDFKTKKQLCRTMLEFQEPIQYRPNRYDSFTQNTNALEVAINNLNSFMDFPCIDLLGGLFSPVPLEDLFAEFFTPYIFDVMEYQYDALSMKEKDAFQTKINDIFQRSNNSFRLTDRGIIEQLADYEVLSPEIIRIVDKIQEPGLKELLTLAVEKHMQPDSQSHKDAVEKIWDVLERLKTYYTDLGKKKSVEKIIDEMSDGNEAFSKLFNDEFNELTRIGNEYRIRHHETNKTDITDIRYYDYFFNRCLSLIALAIQYLK